MHKIPINWRNGGIKVNYRNVETKHIHYNLVSENTENVHSKNSLL